MSILQTSDAFPMLVLVVCFLLGFLFFRNPAIFFGAKTAAKKTVKERRARRAAKSLINDFNDGKYADVVQELDKTELTPETLAYGVRALFKLNKGSEFGKTLTHLLTRAPGLREPAALQAVLEVLAADVEAPASYLATAVAKFQASGIELDQACKDVLLDGYATRGEVSEVEALLSAAGTSAARSYARLATDALERDDLSSAERYIASLQRRELFVPSHLCTQLVRQTLQLRGAQAALSIVEGPAALPFSSEALATILTVCGKQKDTHSLEHAVALALRKKVPILLGAYEALVKGWASTEPSRAIRYFDEMLSRGFKITSECCAWIIRACDATPSLEVARHVFAYARKEKLAELGVYSEYAQALSRQRNFKELVELFPALEADGLASDGLLVAQFVDAAIGAGEFGRARELLRAGADPTRYTSLVRACARELPEARADMLGALTDSEELGVRVEFSAYNSALNALLRRKERGIARSLFERMVKGGFANLATVHIFLDATPWEELAPEQRGDEPQIFTTLREMGIAATTSTFGRLLKAAIAAGDRNAAWELFDLMEVEGLSPDDSICRQLLASLSATVSCNDLDRVLAIVGCSDSLEDVAAPLLSACVRGPPGTQRLDRALEYLQGSEIPDAALAAALRNTKDSSQIRSLTSAIPSHSAYPTARMAGIEALLAAGDIVAAVRTVDGGDALTHGALIRALVTTDVAQALVVYDGVATTMDLPAAARGALIEAVSRQGDMARASALFGQMVSDGRKPDGRSYEALVKGYCATGDKKQAEALWKAMEAAGFVASSGMRLAMLDAAARSGDKELADSVVAGLIATGGMCSRALESLVRLEMKLGGAAAAEELITTLPKTHGFEVTPQVNVTFVKACAQSGNIARAQQVLARIDVTCVGLPQAVTSIANALLKDGDVSGALKSSVTSQERGIKLEATLVQNLASFGARRAAQDPTLTPLLERIGITGVAKAPAAPCGPRSKPAQSWRANVVA